MSGEDCPAEGHRRGVIRDCESYTKRELRGILGCSNLTLNRFLRSLGLASPAQGSKCVLVSGRILNRALARKNAGGE